MLVNSAAASTRPSGCSVLPALAVAVAVPAVEPAPPLRPLLSPPDSAVVNRARTRARRRARADGTRHPAPAPFRRGTSAPMNSDSDLQIAGDILEVPHLSSRRASTPPPWPSSQASPAPSPPTAPGGPPSCSTTPPPAGTPAADRPGYEVWLLSWVPGQGSGLHDHGRSSGVLTVLDGALTERTERATRALRAGAQRVFAPGYVHEVVNDTLEPAVSLHVYFPGLTEMPMLTASRSGRPERGRFGWSPPTATERRARSPSEQDPPRRRVCRGSTPGHALSCPPARLAPMRIVVRQAASAVPGFCVV